MKKLIPLLIFITISFGCERSENRTETSSSSTSKTANSNSQNRSASNSNINKSAAVNSDIQNSAVARANKNKRDLSYLQNIKFINEKIGRVTQDKDGIIGEVKNIGSKTVKILSIRVVFMDNNGRKISESDFPVVSENSSNADPSKPLKPNESRKFSFDIYDQANLTNNFKLYVIEAETDK
jgi:hypothetical protein